MRIVIGCGCIQKYGISANKKKKKKVPKSVLYGWIFGVVR
jgi:hypothetical protein